MFEKHQKLVVDLLYYDSVILKRLNEAYKRFWSCTSFASRDHQFGGKYEWRSYMVHWSIGE